MKAKKIVSNNNNGRISDDNFANFIHELRERNVLLMVGRGFESNRNFFNPDFYSYIQEELNKIAGTSQLDFSDLSNDNRFLLDTNNPNERRSIHKSIIEVIDSNEYDVTEDVEPGLLSLIRTGLFRFVFTTSFSPLVEIAMRDYYGKVRVMNIYDKSNRDITSREDLDIPTIYYLFGKADKSIFGNSRMKFVANDNDALEALRKWQLDMSNSQLLKQTSEKYILTLGCTQDDWLFRFIWYTLKGDSSKLSRGVVAGHAKNEALVHYLKMNKILIDNNSSEITNRILNALTTTEEPEKVWETPRLNSDVFISYSRSDSKIAEALYQCLTSKGLRVWYDKQQLAGNHGGKFMDILCEAIKTSTIFIAILSPSITNERHDEHVYRREWAWAEKYKMGLTADYRCYAAVSDDYDINKKKSMEEDNLGWLAETDNFTFNKDQMEFDSWADKIRDHVFEIRSNHAK